MTMPFFSLPPRFPGKLTGLYPELEEKPTSYESECALREAEAKVHTAKTRWRRLLAGWTLVRRIFGAS